MAEKVDGMGGNRSGDSTTVEVPTVLETFVEHVLRSVRLG